MRDSRFGLRLLEWGFVLLCGLILLSLLIPVVNGPHRPRGRNQCVTQLKNLGLAAIQRENSKGSFPGYVADFGYWSDPDQSGTSTPFRSM